MLVPLDTLAGWPAAQKPTALQTLALLVGFPLLAIIVAFAVAKIGTSVQASRGESAPVADSLWVERPAGRRRDRGRSGAARGRRRGRRRDAGGARVPAGESLTRDELQRIEKAVHNAEAFSGLTFSVFVGVAEEDARAYAERLHGALEDPAHSVLVLCDPEFHALEIVTGSEARRWLTDVGVRAGRRDDADLVRGRRHRRRTGGRRPAAGRGRPAPADPAHQQADVPTSARPLGRSVERSPNHRCIVAYERQGAHSAVDVIARRASSRLTTRSESSSTSRSPKARMAR